MKEKKSTPLSQPVKAKSVLTRPQISLNDLMARDPSLNDLVYDVTVDKYAIEQVEIQIKYEGYIEKEFLMVEEMGQQESVIIPERIDYTKITSLSTEGRQKLSKIKPETIGQASRISGVSASDVSVLMVYLKN